MKTPSVSVLVLFALLAARAAGAGLVDLGNPPRIAPEARTPEALRAADRAVLERLLLRGRASAADLSPAALANLPALRELDISECNLSAVPESVADGSLPALEHLYMAGNPQLSTLPGSLFAKNPKLTYLNLDRSGVAALPENIGDASGIRWLRVNHTALKEFPASLARLRSLQRLYARGCRISGIPESLKDMPELEDLVFDGCTGIKECPQWVAELPALRNLSLAGTGVAKFPEDLSGFRKLSTLNIAGTPLTAAERRRIRAELPEVSITF